MIKQAIEKIEQMAHPIINEIGGNYFSVTKEGIEQIRPEIDSAKTVELTSLDALVKMVRTEALKKYYPPVYITVPTPDKVECFGQPNPDKREIRPTYYKAAGTDIPGWKEEQTLGFEDAMIALRARFQHTPDTEYALKLLSDITTGSKVTFNDNGIATSVVTQKGVALQGNAAIKPIVSLKPYRTFQEVEQPASEFLIRITERGIKFVEADGGMWRLDARRTIKRFLEEELSKEVESGDVVIAL